MELFRLSLLTLGKRQHFGHLSRIARLHFWAAAKAAAPLLEAPSGSPGTFSSLSIRKASLGAVNDHIAKHQDDTQIVHFYKERSIPQLDEFDLLRVMRSPLAVWEFKVNPVLTIENKTIRTRVHVLDRPYFGICYGHQL